MSALDELTRSFRKGHQVPQHAQEAAGHAAGARLQQRQRELQGELEAISSNISDLIARYTTLMDEWQRGAAEWEHREPCAREVSGTRARH